MNILLVDTRVSHYEDIVTAVDSTRAVCITFDFLTDTFETIKTQIHNIVAGIENTASNKQVNSIGLVQHNYMLPTFNMLAMQTSDECVVFDAESQDPDLATWATFKEFIGWCKTEYGVAHFDMMACAIYSDNNWKYVIDTLSLPSQTGVEFRASTDNTGSASLGGNWFLESHAGVNLKSVYFTDAIESYKYVLDTVKFVAGGAFDIYPLAYSYNGINWYKTMTVLYYTIGTVRGIAYSNSLNRWIAVGNNRFMYSSDGINWNDGGNIFYEEGGGIAYSSNLSRWVMVGGAGGGNTIVYSTTGINNWTAISVGASIFTKGYGVAYSPELSRWVAVGQGTYSIAYSTNGIEWYGANSNIFFLGLGVAYNAASSRWVAVGRGNSHPIAYSNDGINWDGATGTTIFNGAEGVAYNPAQSRWVAVGYGNNTIAHSTNGYQWTGLGKSIFNYGNAVAYSAPLSRWVAVGGDFGVPTNPNTIAYSTDGISWVGAGTDTIKWGMAVASTMTYLPVPTLSTFIVESTKMYGDASFSITTRPTSNSDDGAITYSSSNTAIATIDASGNYINLVGGGEVTFIATQAQTDLYASASKVSNTLTVSRGTSTFVNASFSVASAKNYGDASFSITTRPTSNSTGVITYSSSNTGVATIDPSGNWITLVSAGDVSFSAVQAASAQYNATSTPIISNNLTVLIGTSTFADASFSVATDKTYGDASFSIATRPTSNSTGAITYSSSNPGVATIDPSGNWITIVSAGDVNFNAVQAAVPGKFTTSTPITSNNLTVSLGTPTLSSSAFTVPSTKNYGDASFNMTARPTSNSSAAIIYDSTNTDVATIDPSGNWINIVGIGNVSFNATQAAVPGQFVAAFKSSNPMRVSLGTPTLVDASFSVAGAKNYADASFSITTRPTSNSTSTITYSSSNPGVATIDPSGNWINLVSAGDVSFNAAQAAVSGQFVSASRVSNTLTVSLGTPTLVDASFSVASDKIYGDASFSITTRPTSNSASTITYSSSNPGVATIDPSGNWITLVSAGDVSFNAVQAAVSGQFVSASKVSNALTVSIGTPTLVNSSFSVASAKNYGDASFSIDTRPTSNSTSAIIYSSSNPAIATIDPSGNWINLIDIGEVSFNADQAAVSGQFVSASKVSNTLTVSLGTPILSFVNAPSYKYNNQPAFTLTATSASLVAVTYTSNNTEIATVNSVSGLVTIMDIGTVIITAAQVATGLYNAPIDATCSITIINPAGSALSGQTVTPGTSFSNLNFSGSNFAGSVLSGVSFSGANLSNVDFSGSVITDTDFTNANISGATNLPAFSTAQKLQLLRNINNSEISSVQFSSLVSGADVNALLSNPISALANATFKIKIPATIDGNGNKVVTVINSDISNNASIYIPMNANETVKINGKVFSFDGTNTFDSSGKLRTFLVISGVPFKLYAGSMIALNIMNLLNSLHVYGDGLYTIFNDIFIIEP